MPKAKNKDTPKITVLMPVYNSTKYVNKAVKSVLEQSFSNFELLIIDDASTDDTPKILKELAKQDKRIRVIRNDKNLHIGGSLNKGINYAKAEVIARMDSDDIAHIDRLKKQYDLIMSNKNIGVVGSDILLIDADGNEVSYRPYRTKSKDLKSTLFRYSPFAHPVTMYRKSVVKEMGLYNPAYSPTEDVDLWFRIGKKYKFASVNEPLLKYRMLLQSHSNRNLRNLEILVLKIRIKAILEYGYTPTLYDIFYNIAQFSTLWLVPPKIRIKVFNFLRKSYLK